MILFGEKDHEKMNKPKFKEEKWVDYDEDSACWGVFGVDSGFCYSLHLDEHTAKDALERAEKSP